MQIWRHRYSGRSPYKTFLGWMNIGSMPRVEKKVKKKSPALPGCWMKPRAPPKSLRSLEKRRMKCHWCRLKSTRLPRDALRRNEESCHHTCNYVITPMYYKWDETTYSSTKGVKWDETTYSSTKGVSFTNIYKLNVEIRISDNININAIVGNNYSSMKWRWLKHR